MASLLDSLLLLSLLLIQLSRLATAHVAPLDHIQSSEDDGGRQPVSPELFNSLEELARIVDISYCVGNTGVQKPFECLSHCNEFQGFELVTTWNTGPFLSDSCGYIALSHSPSVKRIIIAFRGTYSITNTIIDLSAYPQEYIPYDTGDNTGARCTNCSVHSGFMTAWRHTRDTILETVSAARTQYPDYSVVLVGHSLGGAVAALAGVEMQLRGWDPTVTTFGEPKIGNKGFVEFLDGVFFDLKTPSASASASASSVGTGVSRDKPWKFRRVTHADDPVPLLPLGEWGYESHAGEIYISRVDLPPSVEDVVFCDGDHDEFCLSGAERSSLFLSSLAGGLSSSSPRPFDSLERQQQQQEVVGPFPPKEPEENSQPRNQIGAASRIPWFLVPARYRLWELFFAHRDYFTRIGLCVPGGEILRGS
ncbi:hypothetical protein P175DRAFT_0502749 [Aspergillus ochraceoroseus IBT 24754]|nr:uncharacterized protein P175DRAFT_0502749 [Aspergillus ochraceoroseus IBT 24754]PTU19228.1 hypothetical protein P175DRAFT_0502749 [Aspergillus ochraceoroseus IBT 24754]